MTGSALRGSATDRRVPARPEAEVLGALGRRARQAARILREGRFSDLVRVVGRRVPRGLLYVDTFYVTVMRRPGRLLRRRGGFVLRPVLGEDVGHLAETFPTRRRSLEERLAAGHLGFVGERDGHTVAMAWLNVGDVHPEPQKYCRFVLSPDTAWGYDLAIVPEWRLSGAMVTMLLHLYDHALTHGCRRVAGFASAHNKASLSAHLSFGHEILWKVTVVNVAGLRIHRIEPGDDAAAGETRVSFLRVPDLALPPSPDDEPVREVSHDGR